jgi:hypothetical protein
VVESASLAYLRRSLIMYVTPLASSYGTNDLLRSTIYEVYTKRSVVLGASLRRGLVWFNSLLLANIVGAQAEDEVVLLNRIETVRGCVPF